MHLHCTYRMDRDAAKYIPLANILRAHTLSVRVHLYKTQITIKNDMREEKQVNEQEIIIITYEFILSVFLLYLTISFEKHSTTALSPCLPHVSRLMRLCL